MAPRDAFRIALPNFEGPLDLLLHLIREHKVDILDIPIALITEKYLGHLERMRQIDLDIAGEFLVMASTLLHLKSRMLLPREERAGAAEAADAARDAGDPRAELVRRLLEYQKYKHAAEQLATNDLLDRDVFPRRVPTGELPIDADEVGLQEVSVYKLIEALDRVLEKLVPQKQHEVVREVMSLSAAMRRVADQVRAAGPGASVGFFSLFEGMRRRAEVIITFLAMLEMCKHRFLRVFQGESGGEILISARGDALSSDAAQQLGSEEMDREYH
ncbi:MAG: segregation/condensation protein A [Myxococcaceae bacterium]|nr:segregation/condensation protein A [Myxococcaceae bacterium]MCA3011269.1 segregation/condensation protein A [Myxococcaceae bacterium]